MYKQKFIDIIKSFNNENVVYKEFEQRLAKKYENHIIDTDFILNCFQKAFSNGFHGFHFIDEGEHMTHILLLKLFKDELYINTRICHHGKVCLFIDSQKLGIPGDDIKYADFCFNIESSHF
jgi:hypothetical protein